MYMNNNYIKNKAVRYDLSNTIILLIKETTVIPVGATLEIIENTELIKCIC